MYQLRSYYKHLKYSDIPVAGNDEIVSADELVVFTLGKSRMSFTENPDGFDPPTLIFKSVILSVMFVFISFVFLLKFKLKTAIITAHHREFKCSLGFMKRVVRRKKEKKKKKQFKNNYL